MLLKPDKLVNKFYDITPEMVKEMGGKAVFVDLDGTMVSKDTPFPTKEVTLWFKKFKEAKISFIILSNNNELRVRNFSNELQAKYFFKARKPLLSGFKKAYAALPANIKKSEIIMIGDQIYTDTLGAKRFGAKSIYVSPIDTQSLYVKFRMNVTERAFIKSLKEKISDN